MWSLFRNCREACKWRSLHDLVPLERDRNLALGIVIHQCGVKEASVIVGDRWGIANCARKRHLGERKTFLSLLLGEGAAR